MSSRDYIKHVVSSNTAPNGARVGDEYFNPLTNKLFKVVAISGSNVTSVEIVTNIGTGIRFGDNSVQGAPFIGSGYTANSIIIANTNGYLSSTTGLSYDPSSDVTSLTGAIKSNDTISSNSFIKSVNPIVAPTISMNRGSGLLSNSLSLSISAGGTPIDFHPSGLYAYVGRNDYVVAAYNINQANGALSFISSQSPTNLPNYVKVDPTGRYLYEINNSNTIDTYSINQTTGALTAVATGLGTGTSPRCITIHPTGKFVYVPAYSSQTIRVYSVSSLTGELTNVGQASVSFPGFTAVDPLGKFLYVASYASNTVQVFSINQTTGLLTLVSSISSTQAIAVFIEPTGKFLYVAGQDSAVRVYGINATTGELTFVSSQVGLSYVPTGFSTDPAGKYLYYGLGDGSLRINSINQYDGSLKLIGSLAANIGNNTNGTNPMNIDPTGRFLYASYGDKIVVFNVNNFSAGSANITSITVSGVITNDTGNNTILFSGTSPVKIQNGTVSTNTTTGALIVTGGVGISGALNATSKSFNIPHPTKERMNLRYGSLEGPEFGVYVRGILENSNIIELPEYWTKLINPNSITVTLTPLGTYQNLFVENINGNCVYVANEDTTNNINCHYVVYAERVDIDKLDVES